MDYRETESIKKIYEDKSDETLVEMARVPENDYQAGVYKLIMDEVKKRGLQGQFAKPVDEISIDFKSLDGRQWIEIYRYDDKITRMRLPFGDP